jgi:amino-acid N-acetyltransferase
MNFRAALKSDLRQIEEALQNSGLPYEDCVDHLQSFVVLEKEGSFVGCGAIELYGHRTLVRSIVVLKKYRGQSAGDLILPKLKEMASSHGVSELFLLTVTAEAYFIKRGFHTIVRDDAPEVIKNTKQFSGLCSTSAIVMLSELQ